jgi:hypothetical protein
LEEHGTVIPSAPVAARGCLRRWGKKLRSGEANGGESGERELSGKCAAFKFFWKFHGLKSKTGNLKKIIGGFEESAPQKYALKTPIL